MRESMGSLIRTHMCGELRIENVGEEVILMGWVQRERNLGSLIFVDLRDTTGICQIVFDNTVSREVFQKAEKVRAEYVLAEAESKVKLESKEVVPACCNPKSRCVPCVCFRGPKALAEYGHGYHGFTVRRIPT